MTVRVTREQWNHRDALRLANGAMEAVTLTGGGHLAELRLTGAGGGGINGLWAAPWPTADPGDPRLPSLVERYGADPAGRFLAGYTGHALCLDLFGPPSAEEAALGVALHGEAAVQPWEFETTASGCIGSVNLPVAQIAFERSLSLAPDAAVLFVEERVRNRGAQTRDIQWVQHLTLGPPFVAAEESILTASLDRGLTWPLGYEGHCPLRDNASFDWPNAPAADGGSFDLRTPFARAGTGFVAATRVDPQGRYAFIAALNIRYNLALVYCFRRDDFPWLAVWEENCARTAAPWNSAAQVRGMEFGTTPMPLGRYTTSRTEDLFDTPGTRMFAPGAVLQARYLVALATVPADWQAITAVTPQSHTLLLHGPDGHPPVAIPCAETLQFLKGENHE